MTRRRMLFETEVSWFVPASELYVALTFLVLQNRNFLLRC